MPGGELLIEEQDAVISLLETLKERKRWVYSSTDLVIKVKLNLVSSAQLSEFAARNVVSSSSVLDMKMEIDSMASTPFHRDE